MKKLIKNPSVKRAAKLISSFTGKPAEVYGRVNLPPPPKTGIVIGELLGVIYRADREKTDYIHRFQSKSSRPLLVASHDGKRLILIGGSYRFTDRGIVDRPKRKR